MTIKELKQWLEKVEEEGAKNLEAEMDCFHGTIKLSALKFEPPEVVESIMLVS